MIDYLASKSCFSTGLLSFGRVFPSPTINAFHALLISGELVRLFSVYVYLSLCCSRCTLSGEPNRRPFCTFSKLVIFRLTFFARGYVSERYTGERGRCWVTTFFTGFFLVCTLYDFFSITGVFFLIFSAIFGCACPVLTR